MAVRKPKPPSPQRRQAKPSGLFDTSQVPALILTPEQVAEQMVGLRELLDELEAEFGPITQEQLEAAERAWQGSR